MKNKLAFLSLAIVSIHNFQAAPTSENSSIQVSVTYEKEPTQLATDIKHITVDLHGPILEKQKQKQTDLFSAAYVAYLHARAITHPVLMFYVLKYNLWDGIKVRDTYWNLMEWYVGKDLKDYYLRKFHAKYELNTKFVETLREMKEQHPDIQLYPASNSGPDTMHMIVVDPKYADVFTGDNPLFATSENLLNRKQDVVKEAGLRYLFNYYLFGKKTPENLFYKYVEQKQNPDTFNTVITRINELSPSALAAQSNSMHIDDSAKKSPKNWAASLLYKTADSARALFEQYKFLKSKQD